jgi:hypothetical protein
MDCVMRVDYSSERNFAGYGKIAFVDKLKAEFPGETDTC